MPERDEQSAATSGPPSTDLSVLREELLGYLQRRHPGLRQSHEDIVGQTLADLIAALRDQDTSGRIDSRLVEPASLARGLAYVILKRRVFDVLRRAALLRSRQTSLDLEKAQLAARDASVPAQAWQRQVMLAVFRALEELSTGEREAVLAGFFPAIAPGSPAPPATDAERQRLSRARRRLRERVRAILGLSASDGLDSGD